METKEAFDLLNKQLSKGVFLTVKNKDKVNTMVIGWATVGRVWGKDIMTVMVRFSRNTYDLIKNADSFTVSVPEYDTMKKEIAFMGTKSGRDFDKYKETGLTLSDAQSVESPVINEAKLHYECKIVYKQSMDPTGIIDYENIEKRFYEGNNDYHMIFYGEILNVYDK
ncbi:flavin reductase family protein [Anaerofustis stercorihominis]|uniref:flavin reductase family protein n=1 Tax=Anaerofustis stercorihominis TaxID=214853 RepID=UPI00214CB6C3|nr:flavin reductase [Anaerofustis stercorihominis]MCR2031991.1 flavin reductase [Anaerofustis stercorihominis]